MSSQCLYFHLSMEADDDGFVGNAKTIRRKVGASEDDFKLLIAKQFLLPFESGVVVIRDWRINNYIRSDRYKETIYQDEKSQITLTENGQYMHSDTVGIPMVDERDTQYRLDESRLDKNRLDYIDAEAPTDQPMTKKVKEPKKKYGAFENVLLTDDEHNKLKEQFSDIDVRIERLSEYIASSGKSYKSHYATILSWARKDKEQPQKQATIPYQRQRREEKMPDWMQGNPSPAQQSNSPEMMTDELKQEKERVDNKLASILARRESGQ
ncbi:replisome organizer [Aerococcaceae bacterium NML191219]|nr:replisome organizer [Aerococcaceae bacterium NML191219]